MFEVNSRFGRIEDIVASDVASLGKKSDDNVSDDDAWDLNSKSDFSDDEEEEYCNLI